MVTTTMINCDFRLLPTISDLSSRASRMPPLLNLFDDFCAERFKIPRIARCNDTLIDYDLGVIPFRTGIRDVGFDGFIGFMRRPLAMPVSISSQGAWHTAATTFFCL